MKDPYESLPMESIELELGYKKRKFFLKIFPENKEIWIDFKSLPPTAFLCAAFDNAPCMECYCGNKRDIKRLFVNIEWAINEWGADDEFVAAMKIRKKKILDDLPNLMKKYGFAEK